MGWRRGGGGWRRRSGCGCSCVVIVGSHDCWGSECAAAYKNLFSSALAKKRRKKRAWLLGCFLFLGWDGRCIGFVAGFVGGCLVRWLAGSSGTNTAAAEDNDERERGWPLLLFKRAAVAAKKLDDNRFQPAEGLDWCCRMRSYLGSMDTVHRRRSAALLFFCVLLQPVVCHGGARFRLPNNQKYSWWVSLDF